MINYNINPYIGAFKRAVELYEHGEYEEAYNKLLAIVANDSENYNANYYLAECYFHGNGTEVNYEEAFKNYSMAAINRVYDALYKVGYCYEKGLGVEKEETQAVSWYIEATKGGHSYAQYRLGLSYMLGRGIKVNLPLAAKWLLKAAKLGIVEAQREAGKCYELLNQPTAAATLFLSAAEAGDLFSCHKIATFYENGYGCPKSLEIALHFYRIAADNDYEESILALAEKCKNGDGVKKSIKDALYWLFKIVQNNSYAQLEIAKCYFAGNGVVRDIEIGKKYLIRSAESDNINALIILAEIYLKPIDGTTPDPIAAMKLLSHAASLGSAKAMFKLGGCYEKGLGGEKPNYQEAYRWYGLAADNKNEEAKIALRKFKKSFAGKIVLKK